MNLLRCAPFVLKAALCIDLSECMLQNTAGVAAVVWSSHKHLGVGS